MRIVMMGTPEFAVPTLKRLIADGYEVCGVFTQPDKPQGRKMLLQAPPVKLAAQEAGIPVWQPAKMKDGTALAILQELRPDLIVVAAYGKMLPREILDLPKYGCVNVHGSLLPKYRGAAPIQWSVLNGDKTTGVTTMMMDVGMDTGDMLLSAETEIGENETSGELYERLAALGAELCSRTLAALTAGTLVRRKQDDSLASHAPMLSREMSEIDWTKDAWQIHNQVRGLSPWPSATTLLEGRRVKIHATELAESCEGRPGEVAVALPLTVVCGDGRALRITEVQAEGSKRMKAADFLRGHPVQVGAFFGQ